MNIKSVMLYIPTKQEKLMGGKPSFKITSDDDEVVGIDVPIDKNNRHYWEVKEWYDKQEPKPFEFSFQVRE